MGLGLPTNSSAWMEGLDISQFMLAVLPVWVFGAIVGLLLPRPKSLGQGAFLFLTPPTFFRRVALAFHGVVIVREVWFYFTCPGTFHALVRAVWKWARGEGFEIPKHILARRASDAAAKLPTASNNAKVDTDDSDWYVTRTDLDFFKARIDDNIEFPGTSGWSQLVDKQFGDTQYISWRRTLPNRKTEYKSVTIAEDATAEEFQDFYLSDPTRPLWDTMIREHDVLENGASKDRRQVVRWVRTFPIKVLSDREYIIGRRQWREDGCIYGITKAVRHPRAAGESGIVRVDNFYSMWRSRTIPCPKGTERPACETVLLHYEEMKVPENLARIAIRAGQSGFVKAMSEQVRKFVAQRRTRCDPFAADALAFGVDTVPNPPPSADGKMTRSFSTVSSCSTESSPSTASLSSLSSSAYAEGVLEKASARRQRRAAQPQMPQPRLVRLGIVALAAGLTMFAQPYNNAAQDAAAAVAEGGRHRRRGHHSCSRHRRRREQVGAGAVPETLVDAVVSTPTAVLVERVPVSELEGRVI